MAPILEEQQKFAAISKVSADRDIRPTYFVGIRPTNFVGQVSILQTSWGRFPYLPTLNCLPNDSADRDIRPTNSVG